MLRALMENIDNIQEHMVNGSREMETQRIKEVLRKKN